MIGRNWQGAGFNIPYSDNCSGWRLENNGGTNCVNTKTTGGGKGHTHSFTGTKAAINTMPPWFSVYCWYRTA